ncbi:MAG: hypothetical protein AAF601_00700 [Pseudomonadota bacterium]
MSMNPSFNQRLATVERNHRRLSNGYTTEVRADGLIVAKPKRQQRQAGRIRYFLLIMLGLLLFKAFSFSTLGEVTYNERVAKLGNGTTTEQIGAFVMQAEPATVFVAGFFDLMK